MATRRIVEQARRQGSVITRHEILRLGGTSRLISYLLSSGVLVRKHAAVFALAGVADDHRLAVRAALAALRVEGAAASHVSAAWLQGLVDRPPDCPQITAGVEHRRLAGVVVHRTTAERPLERRAFQGIACTTPARTLVDLAAMVPPERLADAVDRALHKGLVRIRDLEAEVGKGGRRGSEQLRRCLARHGYTGGPAPSVLESRMARLLTRFGLPAAQPQCIAGPEGEYRLDYAYPRPRLMVELNGYTWHHSPEQMASDLARQRRLTLDGWTVLVFTWQDVTMQPERVARQIRTALGRIPSAGGTVRPTRKPAKVDK